MGIGYFEISMQIISSSFRYTMDSLYQVTITIQRIIENDTGLIRMGENGLLSSTC